MSCMSRRDIGERLSIHWRFILVRRFQHVWEDLNQITSFQFNANRDILLSFVKHAQMLEISILQEKEPMVAEFVLGKSETLSKWLAWSLFTCSGLQFWFSSTWEERLEVSRIAKCLSCWESSLIIPKLCHHLWASVSRTPLFLWKWLSLLVRLAKAKRCWFLMIAYFKIQKWTYLQRVNLSSKSSSRVLLLLYLQESALECSSSSKVYWGVESTSSEQLLSLPSQ